jgi:transposase-like protein
MAKKKAAVPAKAKKAKASKHHGAPKPLKTQPKAKPKPKTPVKAQKAAPRAKAGKAGPSTPVKATAGVKARAVKTAPSVKHEAASRKPLPAAKPGKGHPPKQAVELKKVAQAPALPRKKQGKVAKDGSMEAFCPRCKADTVHTVVSLMGGKPWRARCASCGVEHNYHRSLQLKQRLQQVEVEPPKKKREETVTSAAAARMYEENMLGRNPAQARRYNVRDKFYVTELVSHPVFGVGLVMKVKEDGKIEVLFRVGSRLLVHNRF